MTSFDPFLAGLLAGMSIGYLGAEMTTTKNITISANPREKITVSLVGKNYMIKPPKGSMALQMARRAMAADDDPEKTWEAIAQWITMAFGKKEGDAVTKRLNDPEDDLDIIHISELISKVAELATGNPTT